ncbi:MAG: hypothetical protein M3Z21_06260 [Pseudomonadota bacterium]|nr:hypothetical protein [Pseudomonadota bacterium]
MLAQGSLPHFQIGGLVPAGRQEAPETMVVEQRNNITVHVHGDPDPKRTADEIIRQVERKLPDAIIRTAPALKKRLKYS